MNYKKTANKDKNILCLAQACHYTGFSKSWMYKLTSSRKIPHYKSPVGQKIFFLESELTDWMLQNRVSTYEEIEEKVINYTLMGGSKAA